MAETMMTTIQFGEPYDVTPGGHDGTKIAFPFRVVRPGADARRDEVTEHRVIVDISGTRSSIWGLGRRPNSVEEIAPTLFEYAREAAFEKLIDGQLSETESVRIRVRDEGQYPFDPSKLTNPLGATYQIDLEEARRQQKLNQRRP